ncbi:hypothetical protein EJ06DRAFT_425585 [Trichodelitschia bisporula]|uniref:Uncharacterized protein n=1 Tax=Trichodelitschia bisporula TaxID=703511 RepID=A0A6G1HW66_9PEZI|nr:hypothetical protein EJ06DRAFT_425585 [Trichodelitschia bisporula]
MPTCQGITVSVVTQGEGVVQEYVSSTPVSEMIAAQTADKAVSVYVPARPNHLFWLSYAAPNPEPEPIFYVMKLFLDSKEVTTWCCGEEQGFKGAVMFGLFKGPEMAKTHPPTLLVPTEAPEQSVECLVSDENTASKHAMQKRAFRFSAEQPEPTQMPPYEHDANRIIEVQIYRSKSKRRVPRELAAFKDETTSGGGVGLINAGRTKTGHSRKYYKFSLIDPMEAPYVTLTMHYRTPDEITAMKLRHCVPRPVHAPGLASPDLPRGGMDNAERNPKVDEGSGSPGYSLRTSLSRLAFFLSPKKASSKPEIEPHTKSLDPTPESTEALPSRAESRQPDANAPDKEQGPEYSRKTCGKKLKQVLAKSVERRTVKLPEFASK